MDDIRTIIAALEHCAPGTKPCDMCPVKKDCSGGTANYAMAKAAVLLHKQLPRVMPLFEATSAMETFIEYKGLLPRVCDLYIAPDGIGIIAYFLGKAEATYLSPKDYGKTWRCWDKMPSDKERKETNWNG